MNVATNLEASAYFFPDRPAIREGKLELTYASLNQQANKAATGLINLGVAPGELVAICAANSAQWVTFYYGVLKAGAVAVTLSSGLTPDELTLLLNHAKPRIIFADPFRLGDLKGSKAPATIEKVICQGGDIDFEGLLATGSADFKAIDRDRADTAAVLYTGGTTGMPKGVMLTHEGINFSYRAVAASERTTQDDCALCFLPFNHVFGQNHIMGSTIHSAGCVELMPAFDVEPVLEATSSGRVTKFFAVPTIYVRLLTVENLKARLGKLRYCFSAGSSMPLEVVRQWKEKTGITISESYGMTEGIPVTFNHLYPEKHVVGSVGTPVHGMELQIRDATGKVLGEGQEGEICFRGRNVMKGYLYNEEATADTFWEGGWLRSGDIGLFKEGNYFYIVDRLKDLIITGGENVYPREVEEILYTRPEVQECAVIGLPDPQWGEKVAAVMVAKEGKTIVKDELKAYLKSRLSPFKVPKEYIIVEELPKSPAGKILKREIRKRLAEEAKK
ncbi:MAG TPA: AMP-binding protein [Syntrophorhabdaceae bacterium]